QGPGLMMYCRRCNNTHWARIKPRGFRDHLAILSLRCPYRCLKCERVRLGWLFSDSKKKPAVTCPECGSKAQRTRRKPFERALLFIRAYRCLNCKARFRTLNFT